MPMSRAAVVVNPTKLDDDKAFRKSVRRVMDDHPVKRTARLVGVAGHGADSPKSPPPSLARLLLTVIDRVQTVNRSRLPRGRRCQTMSVLDACEPRHGLPAKAAMQARHARIRSPIVSFWARALDPGCLTYRGKSWDPGGA